MSRDQGAIPIHAVETSLPTASHLALVGSLGLAVDLLLHGQRPGFSLALLVVAYAVAVRALAGPSREVTALAAAAALIGVFPAIVASDSLIALDVLVAATLVGLAITANGTAFFSSSLVALGWRVLAVAASALRAPRFLVLALAVPLKAVPSPRIARALRAAAIAAPVIALFAALLASADRVFGDLLTPALPDWDVGDAAVHVALFTLGAAAAAALVDRASRPVSEPPGDEHERARPLGGLEWRAVLAGTNLLFAVFVVVQFAFLFGGRDRVEVTPGLTYAEYARSGFFQLIAVAALTGLVILATWDLGERATDRDERRFRVLVSITVASTGVILASALMRLALYESTFGFTLDRFSAYVVIFAIATGLVILLTTIWTGRRRALVSSLAAAAIGTLLVVNVLNPDRFVATRNAARFRAIGKIDVGYLGTLGPDSIPVAAGLLDELPARHARALRRVLCARAGSLRDEGDWRSANVGRRAARAALERARIDAGSCAETE